jgi:hypothetical protein
MTGSPTSRQKVRNRRSLFIFFALAVFTGTAALLSVSMQALANDEMAPDKPLVAL